MATALGRPPPLPRWQWRTLGAGEIDHEVIWLAASGATALLGTVWLKAGLPFPACPFKAFTGCPCLTCGATRAVLRLLQGDVSGAFLFNPLVFAAGVIGGAYDLYAGAVLAFRTRRLRLLGLTPRLRENLRIASIFSLALNWAWVIHHGN